MLNYGWGALGDGRPLLDILAVPGEFKAPYLLLLSVVICCANARNASLFLESC